jgi:PAS domain S-box-containing protein
MAAGGDKKKSLPKGRPSRPAPGSRGEKTPTGDVRRKGDQANLTPHDSAEALREREAALCGILNAAQESIVLFSADGTLRMANEIALKRLGMPAEDTIGKHVNDLIPPDLAKARMTHLNAVVRTGNPVEFEDTREGILFRHTVSPVFDSRGNVTDVAIYSRDITRQRENEERLAYLASFPQLNPNPVLEADLTGAVTFANPAAYRTLERLGLDITNTKAFVPSDLSSVVAAWDKKHPLTVDREVRIADRVFTASAYLDPGLGVARIYAFDITERKQAEEALRRSEAQFRTLADSIPNLAWWANGNGDITWYNRRWYEYTGTTPEQMEGWGWQSVHDPRVLPEVLERWKASIVTGEPFEMEFPLRGADGVFRTFLTRVLPLKDPAGRPLRWFGTNTDVSALKLAEDALKESERRERERAQELAAMLEAMPMPVLIVHDPESTHMTGNRAADELLRQPRGAEASLSAPPEVKPRHFRAIKDGRELKLDELPAQRAARGEVVRDFEFNLVFDDGATRSLLGYGTPLLDKQGRPRGAVHVLVDITEREKAEEAMREREKKYRTLIDRMIDGFALHEIVLDASGMPRDYRFLEVNRAFERLTGLRGADVVGKCVTEVLPGIGESDFDWINAYGKVALTGEELRTEQYSEELGKWYSITAYSPQKGFFATIFEDITERKRVEQELRRNRQDLDRAQEVGGIGSWRLDVRRNVLTWSDETHRIFGIPRGTPLTYEAFLSAIHPDDRAQVDAQWQKALQGESYDLEHRIFSDGRVKWVREKAYLEFDESGSLVGGFGIAQDITERKQAEEALKEAHAELEQRVKQRTRFYAVVAAINEAIVRRREKQALLDEVCRIIVETSGFRLAWVGLVDPASREIRPVAHFGDTKFLAGIRVVAEDVPEGRCPSGRAVVEGRHIINMDFEAADNKVPWREWAREHDIRSASAFPLRVDGAVIGSLTIYSDRQNFFTDEETSLLVALADNISFALETISSERQRRNAEAESLRLITAIESAADAVVITEPVEGRIQYVNNAFEQITGFSRNESVGGNLHILDSGRHDESFFSRLREDLKQNGLWHGRIVSKRKDGMQYFEDRTCSPVRDASGAIINYVTVMRDVTDRIRLEAVAESVSQVDNIGAIFAGVRHEIGNPINNAKIHLSVLQRKLDTMPADRVAEYVDRTLAEIGRVEQLLHTLKTFNLFETPVLEDVETGPLLELFRGLVREDIRARGVSLSTQVLPGAERVRANARALQHVLLNLTINAADALKDRPQPRIDILFSREDDRVRIRISDNGAGMNADQLANLFKPFHTTKQHGTGLGLVIVKKMLTTMEGTIEIASHEGSGTAVTIFLPGGTHVRTA